MSFPVNRSQNFPRNLAIRVKKDEVRAKLSDVWLDHIGSWAMVIDFQGLTG